MTDLTIGQLADATGVGVETIRYYERRGLLDPPPRTPSGYRQYADGDRWRLDLILRAKDLGFTLTEIRDLLSGPERRPADVLEAARRKIAGVQSELDTLASVRSRLERLVRVCAGDGSEADCTSLGAAVPPPAPPDAQTRASERASSR